VSDPTPAEGEVRVTHVFDAPRDVVFAAWTDPDQVARWWAPAGFDIPIESVEIEPRVGGRFHLVMVQSDGGARFPYRSEIVEISEPELIVLKAAPIDEAGIAETVTRIAFEADGGRTRMTITSGPYTEETRPNAEVGWIELMANLERHLAPEVRPR
jgi:uncharacterized protein YndB with AHSA1/START domain